MLQKLEHLGVYASLEDLLQELQQNAFSSMRQRRIMALFYGSPRDRLTFAYFLSHYERIQHKLGSIPLHILRLDVLKY